MTTLAASLAHSLAARRAGENFTANRAALAIHQPRLTVPELGNSGEWVFARDRALTLREAASGKWLTGCSVPRRAAMEIFRKLTITGGVACFLSPEHAAQIRAALDRLTAEQAIITIVPDPATLHTILHCEDFAADFQTHRLWLATGSNWPDELKELLSDHPGLPIPSQFIRLPHIGADALESQIAAAQRVFSEATAQRSESLSAARESWASRSRSRQAKRRLCILAGSRFRLWNDAGATLAETLVCADSEVLRIDPDDPATSSPLSLARAAAECDALITADYARADLPGALPESLPWITWITSNRVPAYAAAGLNDRLILADPLLQQRATSAGWPEDRIGIATWPCATTPSPCTQGEGRGEGASVRRGNSCPLPNPLPEYREREQAIAIIADTSATAPPEDLAEFSSHLVLWEQIADELTRDPLKLGDDIDAYLDERARRLDIAAENLARHRFVHELILPAYQQGIARFLLRGTVPLKLHGRGWDRLTDFAACACGEIRSRAELHAILAGSFAVVDVWPRTYVHPIRSLAKSVLRDAKSLLSRRNAAPPYPSIPTISAELILSLLPSRVM